MRRRRRRLFNLKTFENPCVQITNVFNGVQTCSSSRNFWTTDTRKKPGDGAGSWALPPTRLRCACAAADEASGKKPCGRSPTQPLQHRHPNIAGRRACSTGHVSKGDCPLFNKRILSYFL